MIHIIDILSQDCNLSSLKGVRVKVNQFISDLMGKKVSNTSKCKRCNRTISSGIICQACKNELLNHYEVSSDWQTAFEIEKAQMVASRYRFNSEEDEEDIF